MDDLFLALFLFSFASLAAGLIKPSLFTRILLPTRKLVGLVFGGLLLISLIGVDITAEPRTEISAPQSQVKEVRPPVSATFPKQKYFEESIIADGKSDTFTLQNSYGDVTVRLNGDVQALGVKGDKYVSVVFLDVISGSKTASKKLQFNKTPPNGSIITVTGTIFNVKPSITQTAIPQPKQVPTQTQAAQPTKTWQTVQKLSGSGDKDFSPVDTTNGNWRIKWSYSGATIDYSDNLEQPEPFGIWVCLNADGISDCGFVSPSFYSTVDYSVTMISLNNYRGKTTIQIRAGSNTTWTAEIQQLK